MAGYYSVEYVSVGEIRLMIIITGFKKALCGKKGLLFFLNLLPDLEYILVFNQPFQATAG